MTFSKEFLDFQIDFALKVSEITGEPIDKSLQEYTGLGRNFNISYSDGDPIWEQYFDLISNSPDLKLVTYEFYLARQQYPLNTGSRTKFGCFACEDKEEGSLIRTHFSPKEDPNGLGPLNKANSDAPRSRAARHLAYKNSLSCALCSWI